MDANSIRQLEPELDLFLKRFSHCFNPETELLSTAYMRGLLSELERKNVERIALQSSISPRTLQEFLASFSCDHAGVRSTLQKIVAQDHAHPLLLMVAFSRWRVERCFEDDKKYIGMDHFEGRGYPGLIRHLILSSVSLLFLAQSRLRLKESFPELTICQIRQATASLVQSWWLRPLDADALINRTATQLEYYQRRNEQARGSHTKTRNRKLLEIGIDVLQIPKCSWG